MSTFLTGPRHQRRPLLSTALLTSGGNITIDPAIMTLQNSQVLAQAVQGHGGNINIIAGTFLADQTSFAWSATSQRGINGNVNIQSPLSNLSGTLAILPQRPLQAQNPLTQRCAARANGQLSSLVVAGRDTLPVEPGGWLMSPMALMADDAPSPQAHPGTGYSLDPLHQGQALAAPLSDQLSSMPRRHFTDWSSGCRS